MGRYIARRFAQGGAVIFGVTIFVFIITRVIGDPVKFMLPLSATEQDRQDGARRSASTTRSTNSSGASWKTSSAATSAKAPTCGASLRSTW